MGGMNETDPVKRTGLAMLVLSGIPAIFCAMGFALRGALAGDGARQLSIGAGVTTVVWVILGIFVYRRSLVATYCAMIFAGLMFGMSLIAMMRAVGSILVAAMAGLAAWHLWKMSRILAAEPR